MNIFALDSNPERAARMQCDQHVVKMTLESAQLLCAAFPTGDAPYRPTHMNHPCTLWVQAAEGNFLWLVRHGQALGREYSFRYGKQHRSADVIAWCAGNRSRLSFPRIRRTPFALAMPDIFKSEDPVQSYRNFYMKEKAGFARWERGRPAPAWFSR
jgi:hypothetical protein